MVSRFPRNPPRMIKKKAMITINLLIDEKMWKTSVEYFLRIGFKQYGTRVEGDSHNEMQI